MATDDWSGGPRELFARLLRLRDQAGQNHYERVALADRLLKDREWVRDPTGGGGDEGRAIDRLEQDCFADVVGLISLPQLLDVYHHVPDVEVWRRHRFNLRKVWAEWRSAQAAKPRAAAGPPPAATPHGVAPRPPNSRNWPRVRPGTNTRNRPRGAT